MSRSASIVSPHLIAVWKVVNSDSACVQIQLETELFSGPAGSRYIVNHLSSQWLHNSIYNSAQDDA